MESPPQKPWYVHAFNQWYPIVYAHRNLQEAKKHIQFILSEIPIQQHWKVLDLCCGFGRHIKILKGIVPLTVGIDISESLLLYAKNRIIRKSPYLICADVRHLPIRNNVFQLVINLFTSFGYFDSDEDNIKQIANVSHILRNKGYFILDYLNPLLVIHQQPQTKERKRKGYTITETKWYDMNNKRINKKINIYSDTLQMLDSYTESVRVYSVDEIEKMLLQNNLQIQKTYGDFDKTKFTQQSPRLIVIAKKNE